MAGLIAVWFAAVRREKQFSKHFPAAIELLARSVQAGESLEASLELAAESTQEPVASELLRCAKQLNVGRSVSSVMSDLASRFPMMDVRIFAHTVSIHRATGGRLSETLVRLARVIRQRSEYLQKIRTMTGLGRFAAIAIGYMGVFVLGYLSFMHPDYIQKLWTSPLGQKMAIYALISEFVGVIWVAVVLRSEN
jgi:tight adherence protein B